MSEIASPLHHSSHIIYVTHMIQKVVVDNPCQVLTDVSILRRMTFNANFSLRIIATTMILGVWCFVSLITNACFRIRNDLACGRSDLTFGTDLPLLIK